MGILITRITRLATTTEGEQKAKIRNPATTEGEQKAKISEPARQRTSQQAAWYYALATG